MSEKDFANRFNEFFVFSLLSRQAPTKAKVL